MGRTTIETRTRIIHLLNNGFTVRSIVERLAEEGVKISRAAVYDLMKKFEEHDTIADLRRTPRPRILQEEHYRFIDDTMAENLDLTGRQLFTLFKEKFANIDVSLSTIKRTRLELGWVCKRAKYCQLIAEMNKEKRMVWCLERVASNDLEMDDIILQMSQRYRLKVTEK